PRTAHMLAADLPGVFMASHDISPDAIDRTDQVDPIAFAPVDLPPLAEDASAAGTRTKLSAAPARSTQPSAEWLAKLAALSAEPSEPTPVPAPAPRPARARTALPPPLPKRAQGTVPPPVPARATTAAPPPARASASIATPPPVPARATTVPPPIPARATTAVPPPIPAARQPVVAVPVIQPPPELSVDVELEQSAPVERAVEATPSVPLESIELLDPRDSTDRLGASERVALVERVDVDYGLPMTTYFDRPATSPWLTTRAIAAIASAAAVLTIAYFALRADPHKASASITPPSTPVAIAAPQPTRSAPKPAAVAEPAPPGAAAPAAVPAAAPAPVPAAAPAPAHVARPAHVAAPARVAKRAPVHTAKPAAAPARRVAAASAATGVLAISTKPPCEIIVDGRPTHLITPQRSLPLPAGHHQLALVNAQLRIRRTVDVQIQPHHQTKLIQDYTKH
ncbi:MAG: hypothetical protein ACM31C_19985, partial [Acidobacteriota bacterium]